MEAEVFHATEAGTPQGGVISPLLANIALDGMDKLLGQFKDIVTFPRTEVGREGQLGKRQGSRYGFIRYADDFLVTAHSQANLEAVVPILQAWLQARGLTLNREKTRIVHKDDGFDFLGFHIQSRQGKCLIRPQAEKVKAKLQAVKDWLKAHLHTLTALVIRFLNPLLQGWGRYYRHVVSKRVFNDMDDQIWRAIWRWCLRRHPNKSKTWVANHYFHTLNYRHWVFAARVHTRSGEEKLIALFRLDSLPIERHIKVRGTASPDDPQLLDYWQQRQLRQGKLYWSKGSKYYPLAQSQQWQCSVCGDLLINGEEIHAHHLRPVVLGGADGEENLLLLHAACHQQVHGTKKTSSELQEA